MQSNDEIAAEALQKAGRTLMEAGRAIDRRLKEQSEAANQTPTPRMVNADKTSYIQGRVCDFYDLTIEELSSKSRRKPIPLARQAYWYLVRENTDLSYPIIATLIEGAEFNHTTVLHGVKRIEFRLHEDVQLKKFISDVRSEIESAWSEGFNGLGAAPKSRIRRTRNRIRDLVQRLRKPSDGA